MKVSYKISEIDLNNLSNLAELVKKLNSSGHNPATSGNYSHRSNDNSEIAFISESGIDKSIFSKEDFIPLNIHTRESQEINIIRKPSDETDVHLTIYQSTEANCVLHSHFIETLWFANLFKGKAFADIQGLELLKGFKGVTTHDTIIQIPIFENTQDIKALSENIKGRINLDNNCYGIILSGHGIYVWGDSVKSAKRHLEVFEYVFKYYIGKR